MTDAFSKWINIRESTPLATITTTEKRLIVIITRSICGRCISCTDSGRECHCTNSENNSLFTGLRKKFIDSYVQRIVE